MPADTIIIGSGVAGLSAALHLAERGCKPLVLEADERFLGGRLAGAEEISVNGWKFRLEHGVHGIWSPYRNFQAMLARHNLRPVFVPAQEELWIYRDKSGVRSAAVGTAIRHSLFPAPLHYLQLFLRPSFLFTIDVRDWLKLFHTWSILIMSVGVDPFGEDQPLDGQTLGEYIGKWSPALRAFFTGLARNGLSTHSNEIPLAGFLAFLRFYTSLRRDSWAFSYLPDDGGTAVIEPLAERIRALGGQILTGKRVESLKAGASAWTVTCTDETFSASSVILAVDSAAAEKIIQNSFGPNDLYFPRSLPNAIVRLWFERSPKPGPESGMFTGDFVMHNFFWLERIYSQYRQWHKASSGSAVEVHIYGPAETLAQPDALLLTQVISDLYRSYPELRGHLIHQHLQHNAAVHTLPSLGPSEKHPGVSSPWAGLYCAGDWVRDRLPSFFIERACGTGIKAANLVLQSRGLEPWPLVDYLPPEPFAGWIEKRMRLGRERLKAKRK
ncbi:MAG: FAD-dependent oxidoreductase [Chloroflexi bacterium]|nr:FAD-dependent oxidoreductase [Chloroflexota bacterium]